MPSSLPPTPPAPQPSPPSQQASEQVRLELAILLAETERTEQLETPRPSTRTSSTTPKL